MKQRFFVSSQIWSFFILPILSFLSAIILLIVHDWLPATVCFIFFVVFTLILIFERKIFFAKIEISDKGISKVFRTQIINYISWDRLVEFRALPRYFVYFLDKPFNKDTTLQNYKTNICFNLSNKRLEILLQYKDKFKSKITDISLLNETHKNLLSN